MEHRGRRILLSAQSLMIVRRMAYNSIMTATASFTLSPTPNDFHFDFLLLPYFRPQRTGAYA
uniref:Uncharacterized protein n=1 Tax=Oryza nivara TaxID=4536 RepID=A0A0E0HNC2_ORYNI